MTSLLPFLALCVGTSAETGDSGEPMVAPLFLLVELILDSKIRIADAELRQCSDAVNRQ